MPDTLCCPNQDVLLDAIIQRERYVFIHPGFHFIPIALIVRRRFSNTSYSPIFNRFLDIFSNTHQGFERWCLRWRAGSRWVAQSFVGYDTDIVKEVMYVTWAATRNRVRQRVYQPDLPFPPYPRPPVWTDEVRDMMVLWIGRERRMFEM
jgi:hypothetical protein